MSPKTKKTSPSDIAALRDLYAVQLERIRAGLEDILDSHAARPVFTTTHFRAIGELVDVFEKLRTEELAVQSALLAGKTRFSFFESLTEKLARMLGPNPTLWAKTVRAYLKRDKEVSSDEYGLAVWAGNKELPRVTLPAGVEHGAEIFINPYRDHPFFYRTEPAKPKEPGRGFTKLRAVKTKPFYTRISHGLEAQGLGELQMVSARFFIRAMGFDLIEIATRLAAAAGGATNGEALVNSKALSILTGSVDDSFSSNNARLYPSLTTKLANGMSILFYGFALHEGLYEFVLTPAKTVPGENPVKRDFEMTRLALWTLNRYMHDASTTRFLFSEPDDLNEWATSFGQGIHDRIKPWLRPKVPGWYEKRAANIDKALLPHGKISFYGVEMTRDEELIGLLIKIDHGAEKDTTQQTILKGTIVDDSHIEWEMETYGTLSSFEFSDAVTRFLNNKFMGEHVISSWEAFPDTPPPEETDRYPAYPSTSTDEDLDFQANDTPKLPTGSIYSVFK